MTLVHGLALISDIIEQKSAVMVHVIGARVEAQNSLALFREAAQVLTEYKLQIVFVGPETESATPTTAGRLECAAFSMMYEGYMQHPDWQLPHLVVAYNSGVHSDSYAAVWRPAVTALLDRKIPMLFTSYNETEHQKGIHMLETSYGACIRHAGRNPFRSLRENYILLPSEVATKCMSKVVLMAKNDHFILV